MNAAIEIARGSVIGSAGTGRQSTAARADYAAGDAAVLADPAVANQTFELAGDDGFTLGEYAAVLADISGRPVRYTDLSEAEYEETLERRPSWTNRGHAGGGQRQVCRGHHVR